MHYFHAHFTFTNHIRSVQETSRNNLHVHQILLHLNNMIKTHEHISVISPLPLFQSDMKLKASVIEIDASSFILKPRINLLKLQHFL